MALVRTLLLCLACSVFGTPLGQAQSAPPADAFDAFLANCPQSQVHASVSAAPLPASANPLPPVYPGVARIGVWGDSHTASGHFVDALLTAWGFGTAKALPASLPPAFGMVGVRMPVRDYCQSTGWKQQTAHRASPNQGGFTASLMHLSASSPGEALWLDFGDAPGQRGLQALHLRFGKTDPRRALVLGLSVNHAAETLVSLTDPARNTLQIRPPAGPLTSVRLRLVTGQMTLHALDLTYQNPPEVLVDVFSTPGALASGWNQPGLSALPGVRYDLVIFQYGTNDAIGTEFDPAGYTQSLRQSLTRFRAVVGNARCILIGPPDRVSHPAAIPPYGLRHLVISRIQDTLSREFKCQFWNWQAAMGSNIQRWASANPPLAQADLTHLTGTGYAQSARLFATALPWLASRKP